MVEFLRPELHRLGVIDPINSFHRPSPGKFNRLQDESRRFSEFPLCRQGGEVSDNDGGSMPALASLLASVQARRVCRTRSAKVAFNAGAGVCSIDGGAPKSFPLDAGARITMPCFTLFLRLSRGHYCEFRSISFHSLSKSSSLMRSISARLNSPPLGAPPLSLSEVDICWPRWMRSSLLDWVLTFS